jgi:branched-chain amino acid transport system ATP-binding protein
MAKAKANERPAGYLSLRNIETFYGPIMAIRGVSLDVKKGSIATVLGANGAGKSTILKTISGIMNSQKGTVSFDGKAITNLDPARVVKRGISQVPEGREVFPLLTVFENLKMGAYLRRDRSGIAEDLAMCYEYFPVLKERENQIAGQLSGGQQQMLAISRALMSRPKLLALDEPSLGLSPLLVKEIFAIIRRINKERGVTILLVEQNASVALHTADYGYVLEVGRIVLEGTCDELLENDDVKEFYLGLKDQGVRGKRRWKKRKVWR